MNCAVLFFGDEVVKTHLRLTEVIRDMKLEPNRILRANTDAQLSLQMQEASRMDGFIIVVGGLDPLKKLNAKNAICTTWGLPLEKAPKLYQKLETACAENDIPFGARLKALSLLPQGFTPMLFSGITYGMFGVCHNSMVVVIPDTLDEEDFVSLKSTLMTLIVNRQRIMSKHLLLNVEEVDETLEQEQSAVTVVRGKGSSRQRGKILKEDKKHGDHFGGVFIGLGALAVVLLFVFGAMLLGKSTDSEGYVAPEMPSSSVVSMIVIPDTPEDFSSEEEELLDEESQSSEEVEEAPSSSEVVNRQPANSTTTTFTTATASSSEEVASSSEVVESSSSTVEPETVLTPESSVSEAVVASSTTPATTESVTLDPSKGTSYSQQTLKANVNGTVQSYQADQLIAMIVSNETRGLLHEEALKAHIVATYSYLSYNNAAGLWPAVSLRSEVADSIWDAMEDVDGYGLYYQGTLANAVYHSTSAGYTLSAADVWGGDVAYLRSVYSPLDSKSPYYEGECVVSEDEMYSLIRQYVGVTPKSDPEDWFTIGTTRDGGYVMDIDICGKSVTGRFVRETLLSFGIRSVAFTVDFDGSNFVFTSKGYGHGVGMSQYGAHYMAQDDGKNYVQILEHYYTGAKVQ